MGHDLIKFYMEKLVGQLIHKNVTNKHADSDNSLPVRQQQQIIWDK